MKHLPDRVTGPLLRRARVAAALLVVGTGGVAVAGAPAAQAFTEGVGTCPNLAATVACTYNTYHSWTYVYGNISSATITGRCNQAWNGTNPPNQKAPRLNIHGQQTSECAANAITNVTCYLASPTSNAYTWWYGLQGGNRDVNIYHDTNGGGLCPT